MNNSNSGLLWIILSIFLMIPLYIFDLEKNEQREAELKQVQIIKEAESSNDPVLKQKAARLKLEIANREAELKQKAVKEKNQKIAREQLEHDLGITDEVKTILLIIAVMIIVFVATKIHQKFSSPRF